MRQNQERGRGQSKEQVPRRSAGVAQCAVRARLGKDGPASLMRPGGPTWPWDSEVWAACAAAEDALHRETQPRLGRSNDSTPQPS